MADKLDASSSRTLCEDPAPKICCICNDSTGDLVQQPKHDSYERFLQSMKVRVLYGDHAYIDIKDGLGDATVNDLIQNKITWHRHCYSTAIHKVHIEHLKHR